MSETADAFTPKRRGRPPHPKAPGPSTVEKMPMSECAFRLKALGEGRQWKSCGGTSWNFGN